MQKSPVKPLFLLLFPIFLFYVSCNDQEKATGLIDSIVVSQRVNKDGITNIVATCPEGKQMVGGGYAVIVGNNINIRGSYPASRNTWQVDVESHEKPNAEEGTIQVYVYFYTGDKELGMQIRKESKTLTGPGSLSGLSNDLRAANILKPAATNVVTSGGFKIEPGFDINDVSVIGSYPTLVNRPGIEDNVDGWTNSMYVFREKSVIVTNYILYSTGTLEVGASTPVLDQGTALVQNSPMATSVNTWQIEEKGNYFCTGGGYNLTKSGSGVEPFNPIGILQSNAITNAGLFFGWQFTTNIASTYKQDIYALQIKMH